MSQVFASDIKQGIASQLMRLFTRSGYWLKRKDVSSHRKRVEVKSARLTRIHGVVLTGQQAYQPKACSVSHRRQLFGDPRFTSVGLGLCARNPRIQLPLSDCFLTVVIELKVFTESLAMKLITVKVINDIETKQKLEK